jgi:hypothetical protein
LSRYSTKNWSKFTKMKELYYFLSKKLSKIWVSDLGSKISDAGVKKASDPGSATLSKRCGAGFLPHHPPPAPSRQLVDQYGINCRVESV